MQSTTDGILEHMKLYSWNVNGIRAVVRKGELQTFLSEQQPDILCLQETKAEQGQAEFDASGYEEYWNSSRTKKGYSGTAIFTKVKPISIINDIPDEFVKAGGLVLDNYGHSNDEGRVIAAEFDDFYVVTAYTPNAKDDLSRIPLRQQWDKAMALYCKALNEGKVNLRKLSGERGLDEVQGAPEQHTEPYSTYDEGAAQGATQQFAKPVLYCGDMNVAHQEIDLANPKPNVGKKGFTTEERAGFDNWLAAGFTDVFRRDHEGNGYYTWWSHFANSRARNVGWRIDYWLASNDIADKVKNPQIHASQMGSDHCPISIEL
ncbi:exodeoxyribonuclease III [Candidatus Saccharibacteria bacterium]|nr:MAG: exodeoxyribonuclease III [Candidatus Saccharibacteria bacterium]